ncbi:hypothetical protein D9758_007060 [Tetrapyrgos nigripes]|uniref:Epoxide hydrolase N-terminal domain-containing protein n=1 Tax=Tetrapyrgos nigripes TaxID=182062 RepID=A0A8H5LMQ3_9AGAR|nr:hypothetical protein D9758_007060 [Tetrapyrgos nigripes]
MSSTEVPFKISVPDDQLDLLRKKLDLITPTNSRTLSGDGYDWRAEESKLNEELPQFTRDIEVTGHGTLNIHYVHKKSEVENAIPLLFVHRWPSSFIEVRKILPLLVQASPNGKSLSFHVVALRLPGYGISEAPRKPGFVIEQHVEVGHKLIVVLRYNEYGEVGKDIVPGVQMMGCLRYFITLTLSPQPPFSPQTTIFPALLPCPPLSPPSAASLYHSTNTLSYFFSFRNLKRDSGRKG